LLSRRTGLYGLEIEAFALLHPGQRAADGELVVMAVSQASPAPRHGERPGRDLLAMKPVGFSIIPFFDLDRPARFRHRLGADEPFRQADAKSGGGLAIAAVGNGEDRLV